MNKTKILFEDVRERDVDLLMMSLFSSSREIFCRFVKEINIADYQDYLIESLEHSFMDRTGESDITIIATNGSKRLGILIENKISAGPQNEQAIRYQERGNNGILTGEYDAFVVVLIAPAEYLNFNTQNYPNQISYERIIEIVASSDFDSKNYATSLLKRAITKQKNGYIMIPNKEATNFYTDYIACWKECGFEQIGNLKTKEGKEHPRSGGWIEFKTEIKGLNITHKSDRGYIDLEFTHCLGKSAEIQKILKEVVDDIENYPIVDTGKSASIRIKKKPVASNANFESQKVELIECMKVVVELTKLSRRMDRQKVEELLASVK